MCSMARDGWWGVATGKTFYRCKEDHPRCLEGEKKEAENGEEGEAKTGLTAEGAAKGKEGGARRRAEETAAPGKEPNTVAKVDVFAGEVTMNVCGKVGRHRRVVAHAFRPPAAVVFG